MDPQRIGPYRIESRLGSGGMGVVWAARDERLGRRVAVKCLDPDRDPPPDRRERLRREARALAAVRHPDVAEVYDVVEEAGALYVVMELVEGPTLAARLLSGPLEPAEAARIAGRIARALEAVHSHHLVHRDLKADNIVVGADGRVTVLDFGVAKRIDPDRSEASLTSDGVVMGTSRAMSPEQATGREVDHRSDLFSLGSLLYEMLTGRHPFQGSTPLETMERVARHRPPPVGRVRADIPEPLERLVERLLEKRASRRPSGAAEVAAVLESVAAAGADPTSDGGVAPGVRRPHPAMAVAAVTMVSALAVTVAAWWWSATRLPDPPPSVAVVTDGPSVAWRLPVTAALGQITHVAPAAAVDGCGVDDPAAVGLAAASSEVVRVTAADDGVNLERWTTDPVHRLAASTVAGDPVPATVAAAIGALYPGRRIDESGLPRVPPSTLGRLERLRARIDEAVTPDALESAELELRTLAAGEPGLLEAHVLDVSASVRLADGWHRPDARDRARIALAAARSAAPEDPRVTRAAFEVALSAGDLDEAARIVAGTRVADDRWRRWCSARLAAARGDVAAALTLADAAGPLPATCQLEVGEWELTTGGAADAHERMNAALRLAPRSQRLRAGAVGLELLHGDATHALELAAGLGDLEALARAATALRLARPDLALEAVRGDRATEHPAAGWLASLALHALGRDGEAAREAVETLESLRYGPNRGWREADPWVPTLLALAGRPAEAVESSTALVERRPRDPRTLAAAAHAAMVAGDRTTADALTARAVEAGLHPQWRHLLASDDGTPR